MQKSFVFDINKCDGCQACQIACIIENLLPFKTSWRSIYTFNEKRIPTIPVYHFSMGCNHCVEAPCLEHCPAKAITRDEFSGAVIINPDYCIGCQYCSWQCPYNAPRYNESKGIMEKCTFCTEKIKEEKEPACVSACPTNALNFENYVKKERKEHKTLHGFPCTGTKPAYRIIRFNKKDVKMSSEENSNFKNQIKDLSKGRSGFFSKISDELPLLIFTFFATLLISYFIGSFMNRTYLSPFVFLPVSFLSLIFGSYHLGNFKKSYRIIFNPKSSWVSREIIFYSFFILSSGIYFFWLASSIIGWLASIFGILTLISIDGIYETRSRIKTTRLHSAETLITGFLLIGFLTLNPYIIPILSLFKLILYIQRKFIFYKKDEPVRIIISVFRILLGIFIPLFLYYFYGGGFIYSILISAIIGELLDRIEFYVELEFITPQNQIEKDLRLLLNI